MKKILIFFLLLLPAFLVGQNFTFYYGKDSAQVLSINEDTLFLSKGGFVVLPSVSGGSGSGTPLYDSLGTGSIFFDALGDTLQIDSVNLFFSVPGETSFFYYFLQEGSSTFYAVADMSIMGQNFEAVPKAAFVAAGDLFQPGINSLFLHGDSIIVGDGPSFAGNSPYGLPGAAPSVASVLQVQPGGLSGWVETSTLGGGGGGTDDQNAAEVPFSPSGNIIATNVQAAIEELEGEKAPISHSHSAVDITSGTLADGRVSQSSVIQYEGAITITESQISDLNHFSGAWGDLSGVPDLLTATEIRQEIHDSISTIPGGGGVPDGNGLISALPVADITIDANGKDLKIENMPKLQMTAPSNTFAEYLIGAGNASLYIFNNILTSYTMLEGNQVFIESDSIGMQSAGFSYDDIYQGHKMYLGYLGDFETEGYYLGVNNDNSYMALSDEFWGVEIANVGTVGLEPDFLELN
jgi:hypothetical protein